MQEKLSLKSDPALVVAVYVLLFVATFLSIPQFYFLYDTPKLLGLNLGVLSLCFLYIYRHLLSNERYALSARPIPSGIWLVILSLITAAAASTLLSDLPFEAIVGVSGNYGGSLTLLLYICLGSLIGLLSRTDTRTEILTAIVTTASAVSILVILEFFVFNPGQTAYLGAGNSNYLALFFALAYPIALTQFLDKGLKNSLATFALPCIVLAQFLTLSRAGILGILFSTILAFVLYSRIRKKSRSFLKRDMLLVFIALFSIFILYIALPQGQKNLARFFEVVSFEGTTATRLILYDGSIKMISAHPLTGTGPDLFAYYFPTYHSERLVRLESNHLVGRDILYFDPHNYLLNKVTGIGIPGMVCFLWLLTYGLIKVLLNRKDTNNFAIFSGIAGFLFVSMFIPGRLNTEIILWMLIGLAVFSNTDHERLVTSKSERKKRPATEDNYTLELITITVITVSVILTTYLSVRIAQADLYLGNSYTGNYERDLESIRQASDIAQRNIILSKLSSIYLIHEAEVELRNVGQLRNSAEIFDKRSSLEKLAKLLVEKNAIDPFNYYYSAKINIYMGEFIAPIYLVEAEKNIEMGLKLFPNYPDLLSLEGKLFYLQGNYQKSIATYERLFDVGFNKAEARYFYLESTEALSVKPKNNIRISSGEMAAIDEDLPIPLIMSEEK